MAAVTYGGYASALGLRAGPRTIKWDGANQIGLAAVMVQENTHAPWNPLATEFDWPGSWVSTPAGVRGYQSLDVSLDAVLATLHNGLYDEVLAALAEGGCACHLAAVWAESPWGTWHNLPNPAASASALAVQIAHDPAPYLGRFVPEAA